MKIQFIALVAIAAIVLTSLLLYSQSRQEAPRVSGFIEADEIRLGSRVGGRVKQILVAEGESVKPNDVLVRLEPYDVEERIAQANAELISRHSELKRLRAGYRAEEKGQAAARVERLNQKLKGLIEGPREEEKESARARLRLGLAQLDLAKATHDRYAALFEKDRASLTRESLDRSIEELKVAQANKEVREQELKLLERGTREEDIDAARAELAEAEEAHKLTVNGYRAEDIEGAEAAVEAAKAGVAALEVLRSELEVRSPVGGLVEAVDIQPGDLVGPNAPVLAVIDLSRLWVRAYVPENRLAIQVGQKLTVTVDSFPGEKFEGTVSYLSRQAEFTPSNVQTPEERSKQVFRIKVAVPTNERLRPGMAADVWLP